MDTFIGELHSPYVHPMYIFTYITHVVILHTWVFHSDQGQTLIESHKSRNNLDDAVTFSVKLAYSRKVFYRAKALIWTKSEEKSVQLVRCSFVPK